MLAGGATEHAPPVVRVSHLSKYFTRELKTSLRYGIADIAGELRLRRAGTEGRSVRAGEFAALDDVSFDVHPGEALAIVGPNGAGKSTLLKVLYGLIKPDRGEVRVRGRTGAVIELGTGFLPVLTGRENIAVAAALMGMSDRRLDVVTHEIIDFAELADSIDTPLRYYSSGMQARLAFAIAAHLDPDILMLDEILAVGDFPFQRKCVSHIMGYLGRGGSIIFVSHNAHQVQAVCSRGLLLDHGRCVFTGTAVETMAHYYGMQRRATARDDPRPEQQPDANRPVLIQRLSASPDSTADGVPAETGQPLQLKLAYRSLVAVDVLWGFSIWTADQWVCVAGDFSDRRHRLTDAGELTCTIKRVPVVAGNYVLRAFIAEADTLQPLAMLGYDDEPAPLLVETSPTLKQNAKIEQQHLVTIDVEWA